MGQGLSCRDSHNFTTATTTLLFSAVQNGELGAIEAILEDDPTVLQQQQLTTVNEGLSALHLAASNGRIQILSVLLDRFPNPDILNRHKQTPLMLAAMHGNISCVERLIQAGANILMFDSIHGRTCLHYAAYYGHSDCLQAILSAANSSPIAASWGFGRFVNIRDRNGATPLHLAARQRQPECVHILLDSGALVCASTNGYGYLGSTPLHMAARGGSLDCVRELLAWGADRLQRDSSGRIPYRVALKHKHKACAALLNPSSPEPLIWPSPFKFIADLNPEAKALLERALMEANREREKAILKEAVYSLPPPSDSDVECGDDTSEASDAELCCICFEQICTIEIQKCGHQMCAPCILALCCHNKPKPTTPCPKAPPLCPFCRSDITRLVVAEIKGNECEEEPEFSPKHNTRPRRSLNCSEGSSSFKGLSATVGSFARIGGRSSARVSVENEEEEEEADKV